MPRVGCRDYSARQSSRCLWLVSRVALEFVAGRESVSTRCGVNAVAIRRWRRAERLKHARWQLEVDEYRVAHGLVGDAE
jgi:hypothetical protein